MGWVRLDDGFSMHPKVVTLSLEARWAYVEALCYAAKYETDGIVPETVAANGAVRRELLAAGLWESGTASVVIHDFLIYNPSKEEKDRTRDSKRIAGAIGAATRYGDSTSDSRGAGGSSSGLEVRSKESFDTFWTIYPRKVGKRKAESAFRQALRRASVTTIIAGAERYRDDPNRSDEFTAHPTTWLNRDGWEDADLPARSPNGRRSRDIPGLTLRKIAERNRAI
jgi:hypothetical protein